jgi:hypothetical protein
MDDERAYQTRVYKFRCLADFPEAAVKELRRAHELSNLMIEVEKGHTDRVAAAWREHPALEELEQAIETATEGIEEVVERMKRHKQKSRSTKPDPDIKAELVAARKKRKEAKEAFKAKKDLVYPILKPKLVKLNEQLREELKATYRPSIQGGLYWANYNAVRDRHQAAVKAVRSTRRMGKPADLRFRRWTGEGTLTVQLQRQSDQPVRSPTTIADGERGLWRNVAQLTPAHDPDEWDTLTRAQQRRIRVGTLRFRIGSQPDKKAVDDETERRLEELGEHTENQAQAVRDAVHAELDQSGHVELPVIVHRPIPLDADICMMEITRRRLGSRMLVHVSVVVRLPSVPSRTEGKAVAVHIGWRGLEDGSIRVGVMAGGWNPPEELAGVVRQHGTWSEIVIPGRWRDQMEYVQGVASIRGRNLDGLKKWMLEWLGEHPEHAIAGIETIDKWRSPNRFAALSLRIRGDDSIDIEVRQQLEAWRKQDRHLWDLEANLRDKILHRRNDAFAKVAAWCLDEAAVLRIDQFNLMPLMRKPDVGKEDTEAHRRARANRVMAAPGILRGIMLDAASRRGVHVQAIEGKISSTHHVCGTELDMTEREAHVMVWCAHCEKMVDQDANTLEMLRAHA